MRSATKQPDKPLSQGDDHRRSFTSPNVGTSSKAAGMSSSYQFNSAFLSPSGPSNHSESSNSSKKRKASTVMKQSFMEDLQNFNLSVQHEREKAILERERILERFQALERETMLESEKALERERALEREKIVERKRALERERASKLIEEERRQAASAMATKLASEKFQARAMSYFDGSFDFNDHEEE